MTRRQFLLAAGALVAIDRLHALVSAQAIETRTLRDAATRGRRFLDNLFDPAVGLLPEFPGSSTYRLFHDNSLAAKVLSRTDPGVADKIREAIHGCGITESGKVEIRFDEAKHPPPFRHSHLIEVKRMGAKVIKTEVVGDRVHKDRQGYADLLFHAAIAEAEEDRARSFRHFEQALKMCDGWDSGTG